MDTEMDQEVEEKVILHWNYRGFVLLPEELRSKGEHIQEIYLKWNNLYMLPQWLGVLKNLTNLYLYGNELEIIPNEIEELQSLELLEIGRNHLCSLPPNIGKLRNLMVLAAAHNHITFLPKEIRHLSSLKLLQLAGNKLQSIPDSICECENLEELSVDHNNLLSLPPQTVYLPNLCTLSVTDNQLLYLPALPFMSSTSLRFDNNPCLNYLAYPLGCQIASHNQSIMGDGLWDLKTFGCFQTSIDGHLNNVILYVPSDPNTGNIAMKLVMPHGLRSVNKPVCGYKEVPTLYEIAMRNSYKLLYFHNLNSIKCNGTHMFSTFRKTMNTWNEAHIFPSSIQEQLRRGPVTICFHPNCQVPIFTYAVVWLMDKYDAGRMRDKIIRVLAAIFFCSHYCSSSYEQYEGLTLNEDLEECLSRSKIEWQNWTAR